MQLCKKAAEEGIALGLLGAKPGCAERCAERMRQKYPQLRFGAVEHGYFMAEEEHALIERINASEARILLVAMGVPRQALLIRRCAEPWSKWIEIWFMSPDPSIERGWVNLDLADATAPALLPPEDAASLRNRAEILDNSSPCPAAE